MNILDEAKRILERRADDYGDVNVSFNRIAKMWSGYLGWQMSAHDVANMMILLKVSRMKGKYSVDSALDVIGYSVCASNLLV